MVIRCRPVVPDHLMRGRSQPRGNMVPLSGSPTQGPAPLAAPPNLEAASAGAPMSMIGAGGKSPHLSLGQTPKLVPLGGMKPGPASRSGTPPPPPAPPVPLGGMGVTLGLEQAVTMNSSAAVRLSMGPSSEELDVVDVDLEGGGQVGDAEVDGLHPVERQAGHRGGEAPAWPVELLPGQLDDAPLGR